MDKYDESTDITGIIRVLIIIPLTRWIQKLQ